MFFDSTIVIRGRRSTRDIALTLPACIVDDGMGDPLNQTSLATDVEALCFYIRREDWSEVEPPQIGDSVSLDDGSSYAVRKVGRLADVWVLSARSK